MWTLDKDGDWIYIPTEKENEEFVKQMEFYFRSQWLEQQPDRPLSERSDKEIAIIKEICDRDQLLEKEYIEWLRLNQEPQKGRRYNQRVYYDKMLSKLAHIGSNPYEYAPGKFYTLDQLDKRFFNLYDTKIVLCGSYIKVYEYQYVEEVFKRDAKTGKVIKHYRDNTSNKRTRFLDIARGNEESFKTFITLSFDEATSKEEAEKVYKALVRYIKRKHDNFICIKAVENITKTFWQVHFHLLTSLEIDDESIFVKADSDDENEYKILWWDKYGSSKAYKVKTPKDYRKISYYNSKYLRFKQFIGKGRTWTATQNLIKSKVLYYNSQSSWGQAKIDECLKNAVQIGKPSHYPGNWWTTTTATIYKRVPATARSKASGKKAKKVLESKSDLEPDIFDPFG